MLGAWYDLLIPPQTQAAIQKGEQKIRREIAQKEAEIRGGAEREAYRGAFAGIIAIGLVGLALWALTRK